MSIPILETPGFAAAVIDALASHICVIDRDGLIITVNRAWSHFAHQNPPVSDRSGVGSHYLEVCGNASGPGAEEADGFASGVRSVLNGTAAIFEMEYPCHSPTEKRWFLGRVTPLRTERGGAVISHMTITDRKLLEFELKRLAATDPLTGLPNRRYFMEAGQQEVERVQRFGVVASLIMLDLDNFKSVNDAHGHAVGDEALRTFAKVCRECLRAVDVFARIGGEEFAVILPGTDARGAATVAEKLRRSVEVVSVESDAGGIYMTTSVGVATIRDDDKGIDDGLRRADIALFVAKRAGRNRVESFSDAAGLTTGVVAMASGRRCIEYHPIQGESRSEVAPFARLAP